MAHGDSPVVVSGRTKQPSFFISRFRAFLERLSREIEQDQLEGLKFLLHEYIPLGILEKCITPRQLFKRMMQQSLLGEGNLDNLQQLFTDAQRCDLAERVRDFKASSLEVETALPGNENVFSITIDNSCLKEYRVLSISNSKLNWTPCRTIQGVNKSDSRLAVVRFC